MHSDIKRLLNDRNARNIYKNQKSGDISKEGTILHIVNGNHKEIAMVLKSVHGSKIGIPHDDFIIIGNYKYEDIADAVEKDERPKLNLIIAKVTGKRSYKIITDNHKLMNSIHHYAVDNDNGEINKLCDKLFKMEIVQCMTEDMSSTYSRNMELRDMIERANKDSRDGAQGEDTQ